MAVMAYRVLHGLVPSYLSQLICIANLPDRRRLRSSTHSLLVPSFRYSTVGRHSFPVAASVLWNSLPMDIQSSPFLTVSVNGLKHFYFVNIFHTFYCSFTVHAFVVSVIVSIWATLKNLDWLIDWLIEGCGSTKWWTHRTVVLTIWFICYRVLLRSVQTFPYAVPYLLHVVDHRFHHHNYHHLSPINLFPTPD